MSGRGRPPYPEILTPAEQKVLEQLRHHLSNAEIAVRLDISVNTVRYHVSNMLAKLDLPDREALAAWEPEEAEAVGLLRRALALIPVPGFLKVASLSALKIAISGAVAAVGVGAGAAVVLSVDWSGSGSDEEAESFQSEKTPDASDPEWPLLDPSRAREFALAILIMPVDIGSGFIVTAEDEYSPDDD